MKVSSVGIHTALTMINYVGAPALNMKNRAYRLGSPRNTRLMKILMHIFSLIHSPLRCRTYITHQYIHIDPKSIQNMSACLVLPFCGSTYYRRSATHSLSEIRHLQLLWKNSFGYCWLFQWHSTPRYKLNVQAYSDIIYWHNYIRPIQQTNQIPTPLQAPSQ